MLWSLTIFFCHRCSKGANIFCTWNFKTFYIIKAKVKDLFDHLGLLFSGFLAGLKRNQIEQLKKRNNIKSGRKAKNCETCVNITSKPSKSSKQDKSSDSEQKFIKIDKINESKITLAYILLISWTYCTKETTKNTLNNTSNAIVWLFSLF